MLKPYLDPSEGLAPREHARVGCAWGIPNVVLVAEDGKLPYFPIDVGLSTLEMHAKALRNILSSGGGRRCAKTLTKLGHRVWT